LGWSPQDPLVCQHQSSFAFADEITFQEDFKDSESKVLRPQTFLK